MKHYEVDDKYKAITCFRHTYPEKNVVRWEYVDKKSSLFKICVRTNKEMLIASYDPNKDIIVIEAREVVPGTSHIHIEAEEKPPHDYSSVHRPKGKFFGSIGMALTVLYAIYIVQYFGGIGMNTFTGYITNSIVMPHMICVVVAAVFSCVGLFGYKRWAMLTAGILMLVSAVVMTMYAQLVIVQAILLFVSYARMGE